MDNSMPFFPIKRYFKYILNEKKAFTGAIVEKIFTNPSNTEHVVEEDKAPIKKPISKFKASRKN